MAQTNLKLTHQEAVVKVWGNGIEENIALDQLLATNQVIDPNAEDFEVNITGVTWTGNVNTNITIQRDGETIMTLPCSQAGNSIDFGGQQIPPDTINNYSDIFITSDGDAQVYLTLRKKAGYLSTVEYTTYGSYDNEEAIGPLAISGAPLPDQLRYIPKPGSGVYYSQQELSTSLEGTSYPEGYYFGEPFPTAAPGLYRRAFVGNFAQVPNDGMDPNFCANNPSFDGRVDKYAGFGNQDIENASNYTFEWTGWFRAPATGEYNFWLAADDDAYMWFGSNALNGNYQNGNQIVSTSNALTKTTNSVELQEGMYYPVRIQYGEWGGAEACQVFWAPVGGTQTAYAGNVGENQTVWYYNTETKGI